LIFWIGVYPKPLLSYIEPQTNVVVSQVQPDYFKNAAQRPQIADRGESEPTR
jgi:NADH:ubiquinone oxidoreductase subunit 4 (subunit M)